MTEIKILIYTDTKDISLNPDQKWSVSILRDILEAPISPFLKFTVKVVNRYENPPEPLKIDTALLKSHDELWLFGKYQNNFDGAFNPLFGGPRNELEQDEIDALSDWMTDHGVLIAGDHSEEPPQSPPPPPPVPTKDFLCLGAALGRKVPRAGELRKWDGKPTVRPDSSFNTLVLLREKADPDSDDVPQQYILERIGPNGLSHPLLIGKDTKNNDSSLDLFPDHVHEGEVVIPNSLGGNWPPLGVPQKDKPRPIVIARGCDKRNCESRPVLAVYDPPESIGAGRIVADSTWHHYFNINIKGLRDASDNSPFLLLQQFYRHVAFFLAPAESRVKVGRAMMDWMLNDPEVWEEKRNDPTRVGDVALKQLSAVATRYEITEMLQQAMLSKAKTDSEVAAVRAVDFPQMSAGITALPSRELVVGHIVQSNYREVALRSKSGEGLTDADVHSVAAAGIEDAFRSHGRRLAQIGSVTKKYLKILG